MKKHIIFPLLYSTKYVFGEIVAVDQKDSVPAAGETLSVPVNEDLLVVGEDAATNIVLMSGADNADTADVEVIALEAETPAPTYTYDVAVQSVTYNGISAKVLRLTGLDPAAVTVKVGTTVGKYYTRTTDNEKVIVLCVPTDSGVDYTDTAAVKALISIEEGTTEEMKYGDMDGNGTVEPKDGSVLTYSASNMTITTGRGSTDYSLPTDLMTLHTVDVDGNGVVEPKDGSVLTYSASNMTITTGRGSTDYSLATMSCYTK